MREVYNIKSKKRKKRFKIRHLLGILLAVYIVYVLVAQQIAINQAHVKEIDIKNDIEKLIEENQQIEADLEKARDDQYLEKLARERLGLIKPGEIMFIDVNYKDRETGN